MDVLPPEQPNAANTALETKSISIDAQTPELIQALYHEITNKTEKIQDVYEDNLEITYENLCELNRFIEQTFTPYEVKTPSVRVRVSFEGGENLQFSSFERFSVSQTSTTKPIKNLSIKYSFLVSTATQKGLGKAENDYSAYEVEITLLPTIFQDQQFKGMPMGFKKLVISSMPTMVSEITYVDFAVARSFQAAIKSWIETVKAPKQNAFLVHLKSYSSSYFKALKSVGVLIGFIIVFVIIPKFGESSNENFRNFAIWILISCGLVLLISSIVKVFERIYDMFIAPMNRYCVLKVTSGDKDNAAKIVSACKDTPRKILFALAGAGVAVSLNLFAAIIFSKLLN